MCCRPMVVMQGIDEGAVHKAGNCCLQCLGECVESEQSWLRDMQRPEYHSQSVSCLQSVICLLLI